MTSLLLATHNAHKTGEIRTILGERFSVSDLNAHPEVPPAFETGDTFEANAIIKATEASLRFKGLVLSDDSGLEVDALGGAPGVYSARYAGEGATDALNRARLLAELSARGVAGQARSARFRCVMALMEKGRLLGTFSGAVEGVILEGEQGAGGFGYDALFVPTGFGESFAQLPGAVKNQLSHRGRALEEVQRFFEAYGL